MGHIRVDPPNTNNKWVEFELANVDTFIIRVGFGLANVDTIRTLTRHEQDPLTRIATPNCYIIVTSSGWHRERRDQDSTFLESGLFTLL